MRPPRLLRLRRFGNREAAAAALAADPTGASGSVSDLQRTLDAGHGPFSSPLIPSLSQLGWDASEIVLGVPEVRDAWVREHGPLRADPGHGPDLALALAEARRLQPDVIIDSNLTVVDRRGRAALRRVAPSVKVFAGYMGTEKRFHRALALDLVLVPCRSMADAVRPFMRGMVEVLPHSFDTRALASLPPREVRYPLVFAGALGPRYVERHRVLMRLLEETDLEAWIGLRKGVARTPDGWLVTEVSKGLPHEERVSRSLRGRIADRVPTSLLARGALRSERVGEVLNARLALATGGRLEPERPMEDPSLRYPDRCHPAVSGTEYLQLLRSSGTVVHRGIDALGSCGGALRLFETTGAGAALLVEDSPTVRELFDVGREVVVYRDAEEAVERALWLDRDPVERERIALAGQRRTLRDHTAERRAEALEPILRAALGRAR